MKKFLEEMLKKNATKRSSLSTALVECDNKEERQSIQNTIAELDEEARGIEAQIKAIGNNNFVPMASYSTERSASGNEEGTNSVEYRTAFMNMVLRGTPIPQEVRANANTLTSDVGSVIPQVVIERIIEKMEDCGMILPLVTRTSFAGGVVVPTSNVKPVATWVAEGAGSDRQKKGTGSITFANFKLRCEISMSAEVGAMALAVFEAKFVDNVAKAMVIAREEAIINGTGVGQPKGILLETPKHKITVAKSGKLTYKLLCEVEGKIPAEYEATAKWCMSKTTFMQFIGMEDNNGQPIARVNYGINGKPERTLLGREVVIAPYVASYADTVSADTKFAFVYDFADYVENTVYDLGIQKKQDWDTEDLLTKAVMSVDGKSLSAESLIVLEKTTA